MEEGQRELEQIVHPKIDREIIAEMLLTLTGAELLLYGGYSEALCLLAFLAWMIFGYSYKKIQEISGIPHANMKQIFGTIGRALIPWAEAQIGLTSLQTRISARLQNYANLANDIDFGGTTMLLDGTQIRISYNLTPTEREELSSYKFKQNPAVNFIVVSDLAGRILYVSDSMKGCSLTLFRISWTTPRYVRSQTMCTICRQLND
jgi:hypothetical protein